MSKLNIAVVGTCFAIGAFAVAAGPVGTLDAMAATHGADAVETAKPFDGFKVSRSKNGQPAHSILTLPGNPKAAATNRISRYLNTNSGAATAGRIGWHINDARSAYRQAVTQGKPLVLIFGTSGCGFCQKLLTEVLPCDSVNRLAGRAVFAYSEPASDKSAGYIATELQIKQAPTITVIEPAKGKFEERARITGYFSATQVSADLEKFLSVETSWNGSELPVVPASARTGQPEAAACAR